jgi:hypothetical protein
MSIGSIQVNIRRVDAEAVEEVEAKVATQIGGRVRDFRLAARGTGLVLQGRCRTYHAKQLVLQAVMEVTELPILANEIRV